MVKRSGLFFLLFLAATFKHSAQCTYSCSSYSLSSIPFGMYPAVGTTLSMLDDEVTTTLPLHFNFDFYCTTYNQVRICSNGFITFDFSNIPYSGTPYAQALPSPTVPNAVIAWNWNDLDPSVGGVVTYTTIGTSPNQSFVVTYSAVPLWTATAPPSNILNTGQIVLHESSHLIEVHVARARNNGWLTHTEGIEDAAAGLALVVPGRNLSLWSADSSSHMFSPYVTGPPPTVTGNTILCEGAVGSFFTSTLTNAQGYFWTFPPGWTSGGGLQSSITAIPGSSGSVSVAAIYTCGNSVEVALPVYVIPAPTVTITSATPTLFCSNKVFTIVPSGATTYTLLPDNLVSSGAFTTLPASTKVYTVTGSAQGCTALKTATAQAIVKPSPTLGVNSGTICIGNSFVMIPSGALSYTYSSVFPVISPSTVGLYTYSVTGTGTNGCVSAPAISTVSVVPLPTLSITQDRQRICARETATLTASNAVTYTWMTSGSNSPTVAVTPLATTYYQVVGTDKFGCVGTGAINLAVQNCVGLDEQSGIHVQLYPNPSHGLVQVSVNSPMSVEIRDVLGTMVFMDDLEPGTTSLNVKRFGQELLIFILKDDRQEFRYKLLVQD